jgi:hypothetical protein
MKYLILSQGEQHAKALSSAMWRLTRPSGNDATEYYVDWHVHTDGRAALSVLGEVSYQLEGENGETIYQCTEDQPIHEDCDVPAFRALIEDAVTLEEANAIETNIEDAKGGRISFLQVIIESPSLSANLRTKAEMDADGWFPNNNWI